MNRFILRRIVKLDSQVDELESKQLGERATELRAEVCQLIRRHLGVSHPWLLPRHLELGAIYRRTGNQARAEQVYLELVECLEEGSEESSLDLARSLNALGVLYCETGRHALAVQVLDRALGISRRRLSEDDLGLAAVLSNLAGAQHALCNFAQAEQSYLEALRLYERAGTEGLVEQAHCHCDLAELAVDSGQPADCAARATRALELFRSAHAEDDPELASGLVRLAHIQRRNQRSAQATALLEDAIEVLTRTGAGSQGAGPREDEHEVLLSHCLEQLNSLRRQQL